MSAEANALRARVAELELSLKNCRENYEAMVQERDEARKLGNYFCDKMMAERDAAIKERDEARRCQALTMEALNAVNRDLTAMQVQRYREELAKARPVSWASDSTTLRDAITDAPNPEK